MSSSDNPRFYKSDMVSLLQERNELKARVLEMEEELETLRMEVTRLSDQGSLSLTPSLIKLQHTQPDAYQREELIDRASSPVAVLEKPMKTSVYAESYVTDVVVTGYLKKAGKHVYVIKMVWSDGQRYEIYRRYGEFFTLRNTLLQHFPDQGGKRKFTKSLIPSLPSNIFNLFGRINTASLIKARLGTVNDFCQMLLLHLEADISQSSLVVNFFKPVIGDKQLARLRKNSELDLSVLSVYPQDTPAGSLFEEYVVLADYEGLTSNELTAKAGEVVRVVQKNDSGWWLASKGSSSGSQDKKDQLGFISSEFLKPYQGHNLWKLSLEEKTKGPLDVTKVDAELKYVAMEDYHTTDPHQLSFGQGELIIVIEQCEDGLFPPLPT